MLQVTGGNQLRAVARDLRAAGSPGARGIRRKMRAGITGAVRPIQRDVQAAIMQIPAAGQKHTGLRSAMSSATKMVVRANGRTALVRLWVNPSLMPDGQRALPAYMEGESPWRHPVYGHENTYVGQASHPYFDRTVYPKLPTVRVAVVAVADATAAEIERGI